MSDTASTLVSSVSPEELRLVSIYYMNGPVPKGRFENPPYVVRDPPVGGRTSAFIIPGDKRSTIFDPVMLWSESVPNTCAELKFAKPIELTPDKIVQMARITTDQWALWAKFGNQVDYDMASVVLKKLGAPIPKDTIRVQIDPATGEAKSRGGKHADLGALRPIRRDSKRGLIAQFFINETPQSIREAMAQFGMTRSGVLSHLFCINRDNGLAYRLLADCAIIDVPDGFDPFGTAAVLAVESAAEDGTITTEIKTVEVKSASGPKGKPLDESRLSAIKVGSKREALARHFMEGASIEAYCEKAGLTRSAVLSHLYTIWAEHGIGHEVSADGLQAKLIYPAGFDLWDLTPKTRKNSKTPPAQPVTPAVEEEDTSWLC